MTQYRIEYRYLTTDYVSHGSWFNSKSFIEDWVQYLNKEHKGVIHHWVGKK